LTTSVQGSSLKGSLQSKITQIQNSKGHLLLLPAITEHLYSSISTDWFEADFWIANDRILGQSVGRHTTWFVQPPEPMENTSWVLRHYYRGGLVAKVNNDKFLYSGLENTRCYRELKLLLEMQQLGLPVPSPVAARLMRKGLFYRADLLMDKLDAKDLVVKLKSKPITAELWNKIGATIADFHQKGIYHADLNAHNILIDDNEKIWLIDFDRCGIKDVDTTWQQKNLQRLQRSFLKEKGIYQSLHYDDNSWQNLQAGYLNYQSAG